MHDTYKTQGACCAVLHAVLPTLHDVKPMHVGKQHDTALLCVHSFSMDNFSLHFSSVGVSRTE
jgi:hypothetical protein